VGLVDLELHLEFVHRAFAADDDLEVRLGLFNRKQHGFDLRREDVDAADDQHVVGAIADALHAAQRAAAGALAGDQRRNVARAEAQERKGLFGERRENEFAALAVGKDLAGVGIDDLGIERVLEDVNAVLGHALAGDSGADDFGQAVDVDGLEGEPFLDGFAHLLGPRLGAEEPHAQLERPWRHAIGEAFLGERERVGGRAAKHSGAEVLHEHDLALAVAAGHRDHGAPRSSAP